MQVLGSNLTAVLQFASMELDFDNFDDSTHTICYVWIWHFATIEALRNFKLCSQTAKIESNNLIIFQKWHTNRIAISRQCCLKISSSSCVYFWDLNMGNLLYHWPLYIFSHILSKNVFLLAYFSGGKYVFTIELVTLKRTYTKKFNFPKSLLKFWFNF